MPRRLCLLALLLLPLASPARACSVPVFRYALERWRASSYDAILFHRGALPEEAVALLGQLQDPKVPANLVVTLVDVDGEIDPGLKKVWDAQPKDAPLPWLVVRPPDAREKTAVWTGSLTEENVKTILDSPARQDVLKCLGQGDSAVFLFLESGDAKADATALAFVKKELAHLQRTIQLPEQDMEVPILSNLPLRVSFPVVTVPRRDPAERFFVQTLLAMEEDLDRVKTPIVIPVFGRGRALTALYGDDLSAEQLNRSAVFLCGPCSCRVKELNPGIDLVLAADWQEMLDAPGPVPETPTVSVEPPVDSTPAAVPPSEEPPASPTPLGLDRRWLWAGTAVASLLVLVTGCWALLSRSRSVPSPE